MPKITLERLVPLLCCQDIEAAHGHLIQSFGFAPGEVTRDAQGRAVHGELATGGGGELWLHEESQPFALKAPRNLGHASATFAVMVADVEAHHRRAAEHGANILYPPVARQGGFCEYSALDSEGHRWSAYTRPPQNTPGRLTPILACQDIEAAHSHLARAFGFTPGELMRNAKGNAFHAELKIAGGEIWLHGESGEQALKSPRSLGQASATFAVLLPDVDAHHRHAAEHGANIVHPPTDREYGYREYSALDSEGHLWSFMKPLA